MPAGKVDVPLDLDWQDSYAVGVESIDNAHRELFRMAKRLMLLSHDERKHKWIAEEGIKFLKAYAIKHFADEEAYMESIRYPDLENHREQHRLMKEKILPRIESNLHHESFSVQAIEDFLKIIQLWLSRHIAIHDVAIGKFQPYDETFPL